MSMEAMTWAIELRGLNLPEKTTLLLLANRHNNDTGLCYPSMSKIAEEGGMSRRTVIRAVNSLEKKGFLTAHKTFGKSHHYRLHTGVTVSPVTESHMCQRVTPPVTESHTTCDRESHKPKRTQKNPKKGTTKISQKKLVSIGDGIQCWDLWIEYRSEIKKPLTERGWGLLADDLRKYSGAEQETAIKKSITNGWQGLFPKKGDKPADDLPMSARYRNG